MSDSIKVAVRIRPLIQRERDAGAKIVWENDKTSIHEKNRLGKHAMPYSFDRVFDTTETTADVFREIAMPIVGCAMLGFNGTIFAYGQTASGKTFTMAGTPVTPGIIQGVVTAIFDTIENVLDREYLIRVSYLEIYNEVVTDLLSKDRHCLEVREDREGAVFVKNLKEETVTGKDRILELMASGNATRHVGATNMNEASSRSHAIFRIIIESRLREQDGAVMVSHLNLVDLAGSEKAKATGASGQRLMEGGFINKSLFVLGNVISQLSENNPFISYRDSRLTRILQNSIGGNSKTAIICNISPSVLEETHSSLRFATNAKRIKNKPVQNEVLSDEAMMQRQKKEILMLKKKLEETRNLQTVVVQEENEQLQQLLAAKEAEQRGQTEQIQRLTELICVSSRIKPSTPNPHSMDVKRKRRETWCPGKAGARAVPKAPRFMNALDIPESSNPRDIKSLPSLGEEDEEELQVKSMVTFNYPEFSPDTVVPSLDMNLTNFSNEEVELIECGCQTEASEELSLKENRIGELSELLQASQEEVEKMNRMIDANLEEEGAEVAELKMQVYTTEEQLREVMNKLSLTEQLREQDMVAAEAELNELRAAATKPSRMSSTGGLGLVQNQLEQLRNELGDKVKVLAAKDKEISCLKMQHMETLQLAEQMMDEEKNLKNMNTAIQQERDNTQIQLEQLQIQFEKREQEFRETEEFLTLERDLKNDSLMSHQVGEDMVNELQKKLAASEQAATDGQNVIMDLNKTLSVTKDQLADLKEQMKLTEKELARLTNEHSDFDMFKELEREKHKRREAELTAQLEEAYSDLRAVKEPTGANSLDVSLLATITACGGGGGRSLEASLAAADNMQMEQLTTQFTELQEQITVLTKGIETNKAARVAAEKQLAEYKEADALAADDVNSGAQEKSNLEEENVRLKDQMETLKSQLQNSTEETTMFASKLEEHLNDKKSEEGQMIQDQKSAVEQERISLEEDAKSFGEERQLLQEEKLAFEEERKEHSETVNKFNVAKQSLEKKIAAFEEERETLEGKKVALDESRLALEEEKIIDREMNENLLEEEKDALDEERKSLREERMILEKEKASLDIKKAAFDERKLCDVDTRITSLEEQKSVLKEEKTSREELIMHLTAEKQIMEDSMKGLMEDICKNNHLEEEKNILESEKKEIEGRMSTLERDIDILREEKKSMEVIASDERDQYLEKIESLESEIEVEKETFAKEKELLVQETNILEEEKKLLEVEIRNLEEDKKSIESEILEKDNIVSEDKRLVEQITNLTEEKKSLEREISEKDYRASEENKLLGEEIISLNEDKKTLQKELHEMENLISEQEKKLIAQVNKNIDNEQALQTMATMEMEIESSRGQLAALKGANVEVERLQGELNQLRNDCKTEVCRTTKEREQHEMALCKLKEEFELQRAEDKKRSETKLMQEIDAIRAEAMSKLEEAKAMLQTPAVPDLNETCVLDAESQVQVFQCQLTELNKLMAEKECQLHEKISKVSSLERKLRKLTDEKEEEIDTLHEEIRALQNGSAEIVNDVKEERDSAWAIIANLKEEHESLIKREEEFNTELALRSERVTQLEERISEEGLKLSNGQEKLAELTESLTAAEAERIEVHKLMEELVEDASKQTQKERELKTKIELLQCSLEMVTEERQALTAQISEKEAELVNTRLECGPCESANVLKLQEEIEEFKDDRDHARQLIDEVNAEIEQVKDEKKALIEKVSQLEAELVSARLERGPCESANVLKFQEEIEQLKCDVTLAEGERDHARQLIDEVDAEIDQVKDEKKALVQKVSWLEAELVNAKTERGPCDSASVLKFQEEIETLKADIKIAEDDRDHARNLIDEVDAEIEQVKDEKKALIEKVSQLEAELVRTKLEHGPSDSANVLKFQEEIEQLKCDITIAEDDRDHARNLIDEVDAEIEQVKDEKKALVEKVSQLEAELVAKLEHGPSNSAKVLKFQEEIEELKSDVKAAEDDRDYCRNLIDEVDAEIEQVKDEKKALVEKVSQLEAELVAKLEHGPCDCANVLKFKEEIEELKSDVKAAEDDRDYCRNLIDEVDAEIEQVKDEKKVLVEKVSQLEAEVQKVNSSKERTESRTNVPDTTQAMRVLRERLGKAERQEKELKVEIKRLTEEVTLHQEHLSAQRSEIRKLRNAAMETTFAGPQARASAADQRSSSEVGIGIIGSVKVLTLESENARLERDNKKLLASQKKIAKNMKDMETELEKYRNPGSDDRALQGLANGSQVRRTPVRAKRQADGTPKREAGKAAAATASEFLDVPEYLASLSKRDDLKDLYADVYLSDKMTSPSPKKSSDRENCAQQ